MFPVIDRYLSSELTQNQFCSQERINNSVFQYWLKKYRTHNSPLAEGSHPGFIALEMPTAGQPMVEIHLPNGTRITIPFS